MATNRFYGKAESAANQILKAFENPGQLPKALAPVFIRRKDSVPCRQWSWSNQLITAINGHSDARGYRQWQEAGRHVTKGEKSFQILVPLTKRVEVTDKSRQNRLGAYHAVRQTGIARRRACLNQRRLGYYDAGGTPHCERLGVCGGL